MKKAIVLAFVFMVTLFLESVSAQAPQGQRQGDQTGQRQRVSFAERQATQLETLKTTLAMTDDQVKKAEDLNKKYDKKMTDLRSGASTPEDRQALREEMQNLMTQYNAEFKTVLTDEQKVKYDKLLEQRRQRMEGQSGQRGQRGNSQGSGQRGQRSNR
jgi:hypothetical protein